MAEHLIEFEDISFSYEGKKVLDRATFSLKEGERLGLAGAIGAGKTTLLHLVVGLILPDAGVLRVLGKPRRRETDFREIRGKVGLLFQNSDDQLFCPTVIEDVAFGPLNMGRTVEEAKKDAAEALDRVGLVGFEDRITYRLSGGEKRLAALATLLAMKPEVLLLDEPSNGLDCESRGRILELLRTLPQSMVIVSHDKDFLNAVSTRKLSLKDGHVLDEILDPICPP